MDIVEILLEDHRRLRRLAVALEDSIGPQTGIGWDDLSEICDAAHCGALAAELAKELKAHAAREEQSLGVIWAMRGKSAELEAALAPANRSLDALTGLLRAACACGDGLHVHRLRGLAAALRRSLESQLAREEEELFSKVRRPHGRPRAAARAAQAGPLRPHGA